MGHEPDPSFHSPVDEKNGVPISPQQAGPTLDLDPEKEPELELEEPQKPGKPSVFVVFRKVRCLFEGSAKQWLLSDHPEIFSSPGTLSDQNWNLVLIPSVHWLMVA